VFWILIAYMACRWPKECRCGDQQPSERLTVNYALNEAAEKSKICKILRNIDGCSANRHPSYTTAGILIFIAHVQKKLKTSIRSCTPVPDTVTVVRSCQFYEHCSVVEATPALIVAAAFMTPMSMISDNSPALALFAAGRCCRKPS
jgi:hypothetical protein